MVAFQALYQKNLLIYVSYKKEICLVTKEKFFSNLIVQLLLLWNPINELSTFLKISGFLYIGLIERCSTKNTNPSTLFVAKNFWRWPIAESNAEFIFSCFRWSLPQSSWYYRPTVHSLDEHKELYPSPNRLLRLKTEQMPTHMDRALNRVCEMFQQKLNYFL